MAREQGALYQWTPDLVVLRGAGWTAGNISPHTRFDNGEPDKSHIVARPCQSPCIPAPSKLSEVDLSLTNGKGIEMKILDADGGSPTAGAVSTAWPAFVSELAKVLAAMEEDQYLIVLVKQSNRFVQFAAQGAYGMRIETTSNHFLPKRERLSRGQIAKLIDMGWSDPTGSALESTPELDPDGSPNFFREFDDPVDFASVAQFAARVLIEVSRVPHPAYLEYEAISGDGICLQFPGLKLREADRAESTVEDARIEDMVIATLREVTGLADLRPDEDGDIGVRNGSAAILATILADICKVRLSSPLIADVTPTFALYSRLNDFNVAEDSMRFIYQNGVLHAVEDVCVDPARPGRLAAAFDRFSNTVASFDGLLREEFGGVTAFQESEAGIVRH